MSRRRRAALLIGLALVLGALAASDVSRREAALAASLGPDTEVLVARAALGAGHRLGLADLAVKRLPRRYAPPGAAVLPGAVVGRELAVAIPAGGPVTPELLVRETGTAATTVRAGERATTVVATGSAAEVVPGAQVDVLVTAERGASSTGTTRLALEAVEVLAAEPAGAATEREGSAAPRVSATLRVSVRQAVYLTAAQAFAREIRLLVRPAGDDARSGALTLGAG